MSRLCSAVLAEVDRSILECLKRMQREGIRVEHLLDVGCWEGAATARYAQALEAAAHGIEVFGEPARRAQARGIEVAVLDLEEEPFPWPDVSMDLVIANQVFEHLKNVWLPMSEIFRVLRVGGHLVLSVPNLASLHNRIMLAFGLQPTSTRVLGPHVRGYTFGEIQRFIAFGGGMAIERAWGVGFHPLPVPLAAPLAHMWRSGSHTAVLLARKIESKAASPWTSHIRHVR